MGTNNGKLKKQKRAASASNNNRRQQLQAKEAVADDVDHPNHVDVPATTRQLQDLANQYNKRR